MFLDDECATSAKELAAAGKSGWPPDRTAIGARTDATVTCLQGADPMVSKVMDETLRLRCPACRAIDWSRDGFTMAVDINGELHRVRVHAAERGGATNDPWSCDRCGFQPEHDGDLARHLLQIQQAYIQ